MPEPPLDTADAATIPLVNSREEIDRAQARVLEALARHAYPEPAFFAVRLALEEALMNAFNHGHRNLPPTTPVTLEFSVRPDVIRLAVTDRGPGFTPADVPDPTLDENLELPSGRGIMLMRSFMTEVFYEDNGRRVVMLYRRPTGE